MSSRKEALRDLQQRLAIRLREAQSTVASTAWLAVIAAGHGFLFPLHEAGEIFPTAGMTRVPHSATWFVGVVSLRGELHGVVDLARFIGLPPPRRPHQESGRDQTRLVSLNTNLNVNCAVLIDQLAGLRQAEHMTAEDSPPEEALPPFVGRRYRDAQGRVWQELRLRDLSLHDDFLRIAA